jgi:hypothetical protein
VEFHHIQIRVPENRIDEWEKHLAATFPRFSAPDGFLIVIARDTEQRGVYHMASVLAERERERVFREVREAGGGPTLLHPLLEQFGAEIGTRERGTGGTVSGLASPQWRSPA